MKVVRDSAWSAFIDAADQDDFGGVRIKHIRTQPLKPGGRTLLSLFASEAGGRPHPRLQVQMPPWIDPDPPAGLFQPDPAPYGVVALRAAITAALATHQARLAAEDLNLANVHPNSREYARNSVRTQRIAGFFAEVRAFAARTGLGDAGSYAIAELEDLTYATKVEFDDVSTGTYHSYLKDAPFVHYLEAILAGLPPEGTQALASLPASEANAVALQRDQARNHLDYLMRHKYAYSGITESDIERSLGGLMIDRDTRMIVSETPETTESLTPGYELLRVEPDGDHPHAGAWVYRSSAGVHLQTGKLITIDEAQLRRIPVARHKLSFQRAIDDPRLRASMRLDWDGSGAVSDQPIGWVSWAGHCDAKAVMEQLGVTLDDAATLSEYRSDTQDTTEWTTKLLVEALASVLELGSIYQRFDGSGLLERGIVKLGGARNNSRPDQLQLMGIGGEQVRWPVSGREDSFVVTGVSVKGAPLDLDTVFFEYLADTDKLELRDNPRFIGVSGGDFNLINIDGARLEVALETVSISPSTGYPVHGYSNTTIDLSPHPDADRYFMGTHLHDAAAREIYRVYLDREHNQFVAELDRYEKQGLKWVAVPQPDQTIAIPLADPLECTLSREVSYDDPRLFQALLEIALRTGQNIIADTDMNAPVWNGVVLSLDCERTGINRNNKIEAWKVDVTARFGDATIEYLVERGDDGTPTRYCPAPRTGDRKAVDFMYQEFPDIGTKGKIGADWVVNKTMVERGIVGSRVSPTSPGGRFIEDQHIKNVYELLFCAMAGYPYTIVHGNKRWGFEDQAAHAAAVAKLEALRAKLTFK